MAETETGARVVVSGDDWRADLPWTRERLTPDEARQWVAGRAEAAQKIDLETCEFGQWAVCDFDVYGILKMLGELPPELDQIGLYSFVRSQGTDGWILWKDLPREKRDAFFLGDPENQAFVDKHREELNRLRAEHPGWCLEDLVEELKNPFDPNEPIPF